MKLSNLFFSALILATPSLSWSQTVTVKDIDANATEEESTTTIAIKKGKTAPSEKKFEILEDEVEVAGEPAALLKAARENWKKACTEWKKETRELNSENKVLSLNCGKMNCTTAAMESTCSSQAKTKIRVQTAE